MISRFEMFSFIITEVSRQWQRISSEEMGKYGLKGPHALYVITMKRYPYGITVTKLAEICSKDKSDVSRAMSLMIKKGLAAKEGEKNRYRAMLKLTEYGLAAADQIEQKAMYAVELAGRGISDEHREILYTTMDMIAANLQNMIDEGKSADHDPQ